MAAVRGLGLARGPLLAREERLALPLEALAAPRCRAPPSRPRRCGRRVPHRRHREGDLDAPAVLGLPYRLEVIDPLALDEAGQDLVFLLVRSAGMINVMCRPTASAAV